MKCWRGCEEWHHTFLAGGKNVAISLKLYIHIPYNPASYNQALLDIYTREMKTYVDIKSAPNCL
jgi:hypothetical protein